MAVTTAAGLVSLLDDSVQDIQAFALKRLYELVDEFWAEISESVSKIEILYEDNSFQHGKHAALLASKVYYYLAEYNDALFYALCADDLFDINSSSEFVETIISKCIDKYTEIRVSQESDTGDNRLKSTISDRLWDDKCANFQRMEQVVNRMFDRCLEHKQYKQALGISIETRRLDMFEKSITLADDREGMLRYAFRVVLSLIDSVRLRNRFLEVLVSIFKSQVTQMDAINVCQCLVLVDDPQATADVLEHLLLDSTSSTVTAYQIGFDLYENSTQMFLQRVQSSLAASSKLNHIMNIIGKEKYVINNKGSVTEDTTGSTAVDETTVTTNDDKEKTVETASSQKETEEPEPEKDEQAKVVLTAEPLSESNKELKIRLENLLNILSGDKVIELYLQFLIRNNKADLRLLERIRDDVRHSVTHNATVIANGIMHCGTTSDQFLRDHLSWLGKAVNWAKFTATATLGVIHKGHEKEALRLMSAYLPKDTSGSSGSVYTEGGGLFALGLIHANHGGSMTDYLLNQLKEATAEPVRHGACLGLGLAAMGTARDEIYEQIKLNLYQDDAITGEAAGVGVGLVMLGTGSVQVIEDLLGYAKETAHEKIIRGIALGIAMVMYGRLEEADELIDRLLVDNDPILRWCAVATIAMAYCGTGNNRAVERLLHAAVSDTNDDVRRWAVTALGFILFKTPEQVPSLVSLLAESYHPHLRFGAASAIGIACAGTAMKEATTLLETLYEGTVPFVRQGALIANAMVLMQQNGVTCPKSVEFRERCLKIIGDRHEDMLAKFGAIMACGILDAGGCNMTISLQTRTGNTNMAAAVGLLVFQNFWFWYPFANFISLALSPTTLIALNKDLKMPKVHFRSNAKPSAFAYPQPLQPEKEKKREKVETAILSFTAKQRKKDAERKQLKEQHRKEGSKEEKMDIDVPVAEFPKEEKVTAEAKEDKEPNFCLLSNPARVMRTQQRFMSLPDTCRYYTLKPITQAGILMVLDRRPQDMEVFVETVHGHGPTGGGAGSAPGVSGSGTSEMKTGHVHASTIGAFLTDQDRGSADGEDDDDYEESSTGDLQEDEDEDVPMGIADELAKQESKEGIVTSGKRSGASSKQGKPKRGGSRSSAKGSEPLPPEPFLYTEEDGGAKVETDAAPSKSLSKPTASGQLSVLPSKRTTAKPMDVEDSDEKPEKPSDSESSKDDEKSQDK